MADDALRADFDRIAQEVRDFYDRHPYPPPVHDLDRYRQRWDETRRRADVHLFWPAAPYRDDRSVLVAGCGVSQAAKYALRWPRAKITAIDVSAASIEATERLRHRYALDNLAVHQLPLERVDELGCQFERIVCTGVLHHLPDPDAGLRALCGVLAPDGAAHLMVYAPYGRLGVYLLQEYCRRLGIAASSTEIAALVAALKALPPDHPLMPLLRHAPDFRGEAGLADALLHPRDRAYSVPQLFDFLAAGGFRFGRWVRQAAYLPQCGALASSPHRDRLAGLPADEQYAAVELFRGSMVRHSVVAYRNDRPVDEPIHFAAEAWLDYVPIRLPDTIVVREKLPPGASAVLINRTHTYTDLYLPLDERQQAMFDAVDGTRAIGELAPTPELRDVAAGLFESLWRYDQVVFDQSRASTARGPVEQ